MDVAKVVTLRAAGRAQRIFERAQATRDRAVCDAVGSGASLREIAAATGIPHMSVKRIWQRSDTLSRSG